MKRHSAVGWCILMVLVGCDTPRPSTVTESSTYKSPTASGTKFWHVVVWSKAGLTTRQQTEKRAVDILRSRRVDATPSLDVWAIDAPSEEIQAKIKAANIDAVFVTSSACAAAAARSASETARLMNMTPTTTTTSAKMILSFVVNRSAAVRFRGLVMACTLPTMRHHASTNLGSAAHAYGGVRRARQTAAAGEPEEEQRRQGCCSKRPWGRPRSARLAATSAGGAECG